MPEYLMSDNESVLWNTYDLEDFFPELVPETGLALDQQDTNEFIKTPYYLPEKLALADYQPTPLSHVSQLDGGDITESRKSSDLYNDVLEPANSQASHRPHSLERVLLLSPAPTPSSSPSPQSSTSSTTLSPDRNAKNRCSGEKLMGKRHRQASTRRSRLGENTTCLDNNPAAAQNHHRAHARSCHNEVEKNYRGRLNSDFKLLLNALIDYADNERDLLSTSLAEGGKRSQSKGSILKLAKQRLRALYVQNHSLAREVEILRNACGQMQL
jgi:hypothetical protein